MNIKTFFIFILLLSVGSCSTFERRLVYVEQSKGTQGIHYKDDFVEVNLSINPDTEFYSAGFVGLPVIPTYFKVSNSRELVLAMRVSILHNKYFTIKSKPCLKTSDDIEICPNELVLSALGMNDIGSADPNGHTWVEIRDFRDISEMKINLQNISKEHEIDKSAILRHYNVPLNDPIDNFNIYLTYIYKCNNTCPDMISLRLDKMLNVDGLLLDDHEHVLKRVKENNYRPLTEVQ